MLCHSALLSRPLSALLNTMPLVDVVCETLCEAAFDHPLATLTGDPNAMLVWAVEIDSTEIGAGTDAETIYAATLFFNTDSTDTLANQPFRGSLQASIVVQRSIVGGEGWSGFAESVSELVLDNSDGFYDDLADLNTINGQSIVCKVGLVTDPPDGVDFYDTFEIVANLQGDRWRPSRSELVVETRDLQARLDLPVQTSIYLGNGGLEGSEEIKGQRRPMVFGRQDATTGQGGNITPTLVIPTEGLFQVHDGAVDEILAVRDGGIAYTFVADYANVTALRGAVAAGAISPGYWASSNADGYFAIGGVAFKQVTADVVGLTLTTADIIEEVALSSGGLDADELDQWTFEKLNTDQPAEIAYFLDSQSNETCNEMFRKLMAGVGGWHGITTLGRLQVRRFEAPVGIASDYYELGSGYVIDIDRADMPRALDPPPQRQRVAFGRNWTVQTDLYAQVSEGDPAFANVLGQPYSLASTPISQVEAVLEDYPYAIDPAPVESYFADEADAAEEVERLQALYTSGLKAFRIRLANRLFIHELGEEIAIKDGGIVPRLGLPDYRYVRFVELHDDSKTGLTEAIVVG